VEGVCDELRALRLADSLAVDPHKWLYAPVEAGCVLVRDAERLRSTFSFRPPYYQFDGDPADPPTNYFEWGPQNSRGFRALKVWLTLRQAGRAGIAAAIAEDIGLARLLYDTAAAHPELEALSHSLSVTTFRYVPPALRGDAGAGPYLDTLNAELLAELTRGGEAFLSHALVGGRFALRACVVNFRTTAADVRAVADAVVRIGRRGHGEGLGSRV
jgi:aromatic-L-amino-acid/L-tryptophan decarboxylase